MPTFRRAAISVSAPATSSACARLSSWHGPAMIEIGRSLPNLTDPAATTGAAEILALKAFPFIRRDHAGRSLIDQPVLSVSNIRVAPQAVSGGMTRLPMYLAATIPPLSSADVTVA